MDREILLFGAINLAACLLALLLILHTLPASIDPVAGGMTDIASRDRIGTDLLQH